MSHGRYDILFTAALHAVRALCAIASFYVFAAEMPDTPAAVAAVVIWTTALPIPRPS
jgi:hypothetical protein